MKILCVIPSRIGSTRLPRKPLLPIQGKPMIQWVYENAARCNVLTEVVVATDSAEIAEIITAIGGKVVKPMRIYKLDQIEWQRLRRNILMWMW